MEGLAKQIFEDINAHNRMAAGYIKLGRQQMAQDVLSWAIANAHAIAGAPVESLLSLCNKELK